jgi:hypothetical protein
MKTIEWVREWWPVILCAVGAIVTYVTLQNDVEGAMMKLDKHELRIDAAELRESDLEKAVIAISKDSEGLRRDVDRVQVTVSGVDAKVDRILERLPANR